jgi:acetyl-CoA synthetase
VFEAADAEKFDYPELLDHHPRPHVQGLEEYQRIYKESIQNPHEFWGKLARELITWHKDFTTVNSGSFEHGDMQWFPDGELSPCYNLLDRHALRNPDSVSTLSVYHALIT